MLSIKYIYKIKIYIRILSSSLKPTDRLWKEYQLITAWTLRSWGFESYLVYGYKFTFVLCLCCPM